MQNYFFDFRPWKIFVFIVWSQPVLCFIFLTSASSFVIKIKNYFWLNRFCPKNRLLRGACLWSKTNSLHLKSNKISLKQLIFFSWKFWLFCQCEKLCMYVSWTKGKVYYLLELRRSCGANRTASSNFVLAAAGSSFCGWREVRSARLATNTSKTQ